MDEEDNPPRQGAAAPFGADGASFTAPTDKPVLQRRRMLVCATAGIAAETLPRSQVPIRGRDEPMVVRTVTDPAVLVSLLGADSVAA